MANQGWDEPLDWPIFDGSGEPVTTDEIRAEVARRTDWPSPSQARCVRTSEPGL
jgi:hypothetical protein